MGTEASRGPEGARQEAGLLRARALTPQTCRTSLSGSWGKPEARAQSKNRPR